MSNELDNNDKKEMLRLADKHHNNSLVVDVVIDAFRAGQASKELEVFKMLKNQVDISVKLQEENDHLKRILKASRMQTGIKPKETT